MLELRPQPGPQTEFMRRVEDEVLYGGAKGGGKSWAILLESLRQINTRGYKALILRRTYPRLQELIDRSKEIFPAFGAVYSAQDHRWSFPSGAMIRFGHCQNEGDERNYQGHEYAFIGFDQLEEFLECQYLFISAQNRSTADGVRCYVRATANPGDVGHAWVKARFVDRQPYKTHKIDFELPDGKIVSRTSAYIPATVYDNKILLARQPNYIANLFSLPERERKALLEGNWDVFEGQYFGEFDRAKHVIKPFNPPKEWKRFVCGDYGHTAPSAILWVAIAPSNDLYVYRELYKSGLTYTALGQEIKRLSTDERIDYYVFDPAIWAKSGTTGETGSELLFNCGLNVTKADNGRVAGWLRLREFLKDPKDLPHLFITENCLNLIRTLPSLVFDKHRVEDVDSDCEDHAPDALRYGVMSRPKPKDIESSIHDQFKGMDSHQAWFKQTRDHARSQMAQESNNVEVFDNNYTPLDPEFY